MPLHVPHLMIFTRYINSEISLFTISVSQSKPGFDIAPKLLSCDQDLRFINRLLKLAASVSFLIVQKFQLFSRISVLSGSGLALLTYLARKRNFLSVFAGASALFVGVVVKAIAVWWVKVTKRAGGKGGKGGGGTGKKREMGNRRMTSNCGEGGRMKEEEMQW